MVAEASLTERRRKSSRGAPWRVAPEAISDPACHPWAKSLAMLSGLMAATKKVRVPPTDLPQGTTLLDLTDDDVGERAGFVMSLFDYVREELEEFIAAGCPAKRDVEMRSSMEWALGMASSKFRGAPEWRDARESDVLKAIEQGGYDVEPKDAPALLLTAAVVDLAIEAEKRFFEVISAHSNELVAAERRAKRKGQKKARPRAH
jgi:hypothetical protein